MVDNFEELIWFQSITVQKVAPRSGWALFFFFSSCGLGHTLAKWFLFACSVKLRKNGVLFRKHWSFHVSFQDYRIGLFNQLSEVWQHG